MSVPVCSNCLYRHKAVTVWGEPRYTCLMWGGYGGRTHGETYTRNYGCSRFKERDGKQ